jgi:hypothetical protein
MEKGLVVAAVAKPGGDDAGVAKIFDGDESSLSEGTLPRNHGDERLMTDGVEDDSGYRKRSDHEESVNLSFGEPRHLLLGGKFAYFEIEAGIGGGEGSNDGGKQDELTDWAAAYAETETGMEAAQAFLRGPDRVHNALGVLAEGASRLGEAHALAIAFKELYTKCFFERFDLKRNRWLAHVEGTSRLPVVKQVRQS